MKISYCKQIFDKSINNHNNRNTNRERGTENKPACLVWWSSSENAEAPKITNFQKLLQNIQFNFLVWTFIVQCNFGLAGLRK